MLSSLRGKGYIDGIGQERIAITDAGLVALGEFDPLPTGAELRNKWLSELPGGESAGLAALIDAYPSPLAVADIARITGQAERTVQNNLSALRTRRLAYGSGRSVKASDELFD